MTIASERYHRTIVTMVTRYHDVELDAVANGVVHVYRWVRVLPAGFRARLCMICDYYRADPCPTCGRERVTVHA